jgi:hypothetical protein
MFRHFGVIPGVIALSLFTGCSGGGSGANGPISPNTSTHPTSGEYLLVPIGLTGTIDSEVGAVMEATINTSTGAVGAPTAAIEGSCASMVATPANTYFYALCENNYPNKISGFDMEGPGLQLTPDTQVNQFSDFVSSIIMHPSGKFFYVIENGDTSGVSTTTIEEFAIDTSTGVATSSSNITQPIWPYFVGGVIDPAGKFLFVTGTNTISAFQINQSDGTLTALAGSPYTIFPLGTGSLDNLYFDSTGKFLYVTTLPQFATSYSIQGFNVNSTTGALTAFAGSPYASDSTSGALVFSSSGKFLYTDFYTYTNTKFISGLAGYSIDPSTGALTAVAGSPFSMGSEWCDGQIAIDGSGSFIYCSQTVSTTYSSTSTINGYRIDPTTGALAELPGSPFSFPVGGASTEGTFLINVP